MMINQGNECARLAKFCGEYINITFSLFLIGLDKGGYPVNIFLISPRKHILWYSSEAPTTYGFWRNKKITNTFGLKKAP